MRLKILFITHKFYPDIGGTEANAEFLANAFHDKGADVRLMTWTKEAGSIDFPYEIIRDPGNAQIWKQHLWADVVFENSPVLRLSWPVIFTRRPFVVSLNTWLATEGQPLSLQARIKMLWLARASVVIAVSKAIRNESWPNAVVIENTYNDKLFVNKKNYDDRERSFVYLGRLVSDKGVNLAIKAIATLFSKYSDNHKLQAHLNLTIIGDGPDRINLEEQTTDLGVASNVRFLGSLSGERLVNELNEYKYMLIPSVWREPFGIVALEGLACGCIPIVADGGGLPDAVGAAGIVFQRGNVTDLASKMEEVLTSNQKNEEMRYASAAQLRTHSPHIVSQQYYDILLSAVNI